MHTRAFWIVGAAVLALGACQREAEEAPSGDGQAAPDAAETGAVAETPRLRAGLWEVRTTVAGAGEAPPARMCLDEAVQAEMAVFGQSDPRCRQTRMERTSDGWAFASVCDRGSAGTLRTEGVVTGDLDSRYETRMTSATTGAELAHMNNEFTVTSVSVWQGACPEGWRPGDIDTPMGRINVADARRQAAAEAQGG